MCCRFGFLFSLTFACYCLSYFLFGGFRRAARNHSYDSFALKTKPTQGLQIVLHRVSSVYLNSIVLISRCLLALFFFFFLICCCCCLVFFFSIQDLSFGLFVLQALWPYPTAMLSRADRSSAHVVSGRAAAAAAAAEAAAEVTATATETSFARTAAAPTTMAAPYANAVSPIAAPPRRPFSPSTPPAPMKAAAFPHSWAPPTPFTAPWLPHLMRSSSTTAAITANCSPMCAG